MDDLKTAIDGLHLSKWHNETGNLTLEYGIRNADKIEKLQAVATDENHPDRIGRPDIPDRTKRTIGAAKDWLARKESEDDCR